jgi:cytochrome P450
VLTPPTVDVDIFSDEVLADPWPTCRAIRDAGPVVRLVHEEYDVYTVSRYEDARDVLRDWRRFSSAEGTAFNELGNDAAKSTVVGSDPPTHDTLRALMNDRLRLSEVKVQTALIEARADEFVAHLLERGRFDIVKDLSEQFVAAVMGEQIGIQGDKLQPFATGGSAVFDVLGPINAKTEAAVPIVLELMGLIARLTKEDMVPGSMGWHLLDAAERAEVPEDMATSLLFNYLGPGFETTISAIGSALWLLGRDPEQWKLLKEGTTTVRAVINETLRLESPFATWGRFCYEGVELSGMAIPADSRVAVLIGSANRDERHYSDPDQFDARRNANDQLAFGHGIHRCIGGNLATAQLVAMLTAFVEQVTTLEVGEPTRRLNNTTRGLSSLPASIT